MFGGSTGDFGGRPLFFTFPFGLTPSALTFPDLPAFLAARLVSSLARLAASFSALFASFSFRLSSASSALTLHRGQW